MASLHRKRFGQEKSGHRIRTPMLLSLGSVLGIDIGWSPIRKTSTVCRLDWDDQNVTWAVERFRAAEPERAEQITRVAGTARLSAVAFDGPLRRGLDEIRHYRTAERMLTRRLLPFIGKPVQSSAPVAQALNRNANACASIVLDRCHL